MALADTMTELRLGTSSIFVDKMFAKCLLCTNLWVTTIQLEVCLPNDMNPTFQEHFILQREYKKGLMMLSVGHSEAIYNTTAVNLLQWHTLFNVLALCPKFLSSCSMIMHMP